MKNVKVDVMSKAGVWVEEDGKQEVDRITISDIHVCVSLVC